MQSLEKQIIKQTKQFVKEQLKSAESGHDYNHIMRVYKLAKQIHSKEKLNHSKIDLFVIKMSALLHDIDDWKFKESDNQCKVGEFLQKIQNINESRKNRIIFVIDNISFNGNQQKNHVFKDCLEGQIVQDSDRIDALGAIGVARCFSYGGYKKRIMYDPNISPQTFQTSDEYKKNEGTTINHFYEKLFLLKDLMNTLTGKSMAEQRHKFMEEFVQTFKDEWNSKF